MLSGLTRPSGSVATRYTRLASAYTPPLSAASSCLTLLYAAHWFVAARGACEDFRKTSTSATFTAVTEEHSHDDGGVSCE